MLLYVVLVVAIGLLSSAAITATLREVARDGYRAVRTDALRIPDLSAPSEGRIR